MDKSLCQDVKSMFAQWQQGEDISANFHDEYTFNGMTSTIKPLDALFKTYPESLKGKALFDAWQSDFMSFAQPLEMKITNLSQSGNSVFAEFEQTCIFFNQVKHEMTFVNKFTYNGSKVIRIECFGNLQPLEAKFTALAQQRASNLDTFEKMSKAFQSGDVSAMVSMIHPDCTMTVPKCDIAPFSDMYVGDYPNGPDGFLAWMQKFGQHYTEIESLKPISVTALDANTTISDWELKGYQFGRYSDGSILSTWKHSFENGMITAVQCLDILDKNIIQTTPTQNLAIFNKCFMAWATGDLETMLSLTHDEYTYDCPKSRVAPFKNVFKSYGKGPDALKDFVQSQKGVVEFKACKPTQVRADEDKLFVVWETEELWGGETAVKGSNQWIWTFKDGKIFHIRDLTDMQKYESCL